MSQTQALYVLPPWAGLLRWWHLFYAQGSERSCSMSSVTQLVPVPFKAGSLALRPPRKTRAHFSLGKGQML